MSSKAKTRYRLLVDVQYPPHPAPQPAGAVVDDYPPSAVAADLAQGWIAETTDPVGPPPPPQEGPPA